MSDCPNSAHGHELTYKNQYRILSKNRIAQSCYCIHCSDEMRRIYTPQSPNLVDELGGDELTNQIHVVGPESIRRELRGPGVTKSIVYVASHIEERPLTEPSLITPP